MRTLKIGDEVMWWGNFGMEPAKKAKIIGMQITAPYEKYGKPVEEVSFDLVRQNRG